MERISYTCSETRFATADYKKVHNADRNSDKGFYKKVGRDVIDREIIAP